MMDWKLIYSVLKDILLLAFFVYTLWSNRQKVTAARFTILEERVAACLPIVKHEEIEEKQDSECAAHRRKTEKIDRELQRIEGEIKHLPSSRDYAEINGKLEHIAGSLNGLRRAVDLMNEHLISQGGK